MTLQYLVSTLFLKLDFQKAFGLSVPADVGWSPSWEFWVSFICDEQNIGRWRVVRGTDVRSSYRGVLIEIVTEMATIAQELSVG